MKTYKYNKLIIIPLVIIAYVSLITGYIKMLEKVNNSGFPILMSGTGTVILLILSTYIGILTLKTNISVNESYIKITKFGKETRKIDFSKINSIDYFEMPIFKFMNFLYIYEENKGFESIDFEMKNHFELYKEIVKKVKNNPNIQINPKLLKRLNKKKLYNELFM